MARTAKAKSPAQVNFENAKKALTKAKEANEKTPTDTTKKALEHAKGAFESAKDAAARDRFIRVGNVRVKSALKQIDGIGAMGNPSSYRYTASDVSKIETLVNSHVTAAMAALNAALNAPKSVTKEKSTENIFG
jgi:hypothetical protein